MDVFKGKVDEAVPAKDYVSLRHLSAGDIQEREPAAFSDANNCKDPRYR